MKTPGFVAAVAAVAAALVITAGADAGIMYTVRTGDDMLRRIDTNTLQITDVGLLGAGFDFGDLAYDVSTNTMYMTQGFAGSGFYTVDLNTGAATNIGNTGFTDMFGLAFDQTGQLYGGRSTTGFGLYKINKANGASALIGNAGVGLDGLAYDSQRDILVGAFAGPGDLYSMDRATGGAVLLDDGPFFNNCGITYDNAQDKLYLIDWSGNLIQFDPANNYSQTVVLSGLGAHDGLSFIVPAPGTMGVLALAGLVAGRRRR